jgi:hypothetical protein
MQLRSLVVRGLAKEVEEDLNKLLSLYEGIRVVKLGQSESADHITVTLIVEIPDPVPDAASSSEVE